MRELTFKLYAVVILITVCAGLGACGNTAKGFGQDMEKAGQNIQNSVEK